MEFRTRFNHKATSGTPFEGKSMTVQSFKDEVDINNIMSRATVSGVIGSPGPNARSPMFGDFSSGFDFHQANIALCRAQESFEALPASIRDRFNNDPGELLDFLGKEENRDEAIRLGILQKLAEDKPDIVPATVSPVVTGEGA